MINRISRDTAVETIIKLFRNTSEDAVTVEEAYSVWGRDLTRAKENRSWLSNKLTHLRYHGLVQPVYAIVGKKRILSKIQLTIDGYRALGRTTESIIPPKEIPEIQNGHRELSLDDVLKAIPRLKQEHPGFDITITITQKEM